MLRVAALEHLAPTFLAAGITLGDLRTFSTRDLQDVFGIPLPIAQKILVAARRERLQDRGAMACTPKHRRLLPQFARSHAELVGDVEHLRTLLITEPDTSELVAEQALRLRDEVAQMKSLTQTIIAEAPMDESLASPLQQCSDTLREPGLTTATPRELLRRLEPLVSPQMESQCLDMPTRSNVPGSEGESDAEKEAEPQVDATPARPTAGGMASPEQPAPQDPAFPQHRYCATRSPAAFTGPATGARPPAARGSTVAKNCMQTTSIGVRKLFASLVASRQACVFLTFSYKHGVGPPLRLSLPY